MDPFGNSVDLRDDLNATGENNQSNSILAKNKKLFIIIFVIILVLTIGILVLIFFILNNDDNKNDNKDGNQNIPDDPNPNPKDSSGEINCIYSINDINSNISLLSKEFENYNNTIIDIYINNEKIPFFKEYKFSKVGNYNIKYILNSVFNMDNMFKDILSIESINIKSISPITILSMKSVFEGCSNLKTINLYEALLNTKNVVDMSSMFNGCNSLNYLDLSILDTSNVVNMSYMFSNLYNLTSLSIISFDTSKVKYMDFMFYNDYIIEDIEINFNTENVENMKGMFWNCFNLRQINSHLFNTRKVKNFDYMFANCTSIQILNLCSFYTVDCDSFKEMFSGCNRMIVEIQENIEDYENLLDVILNSDLNIRFVLPTNPYLIQFPFPFPY